MRKAALITLLLAIGSITFAQTGDFIVIRKNNQSVKTFFAGSIVRFRTISGEWFDGKIENIKHDSIFFREVVVRQVPTPWGVPRLDTMTTYIRTIHFKDISAIPRPSRSFAYVRNGTLLMIGGAGYFGLNIINSAYQRYAPFGKDNRGRLVAAAGVFAIGKLMQKLHRPYLAIGKKYTVSYIKA